MPLLVRSRVVHQRTAQRADDGLTITVRPRRLEQLRETAALIFKLETEASFRSLPRCRFIYRHGVPLPIAAPQRLQNEPFA